MKSTKTITMTENNSCLEHPTMQLRWFISRNDKGRKKARLQQKHKLTYSDHIEFEWRNIEEVN